MKEIEITKYKYFQVATARGNSTFVAWAKIGEIQADNPINEPGCPVWFDFGKTRDEAKHNILASLPRWLEPAK